jgi:hypothetical protein
MGLKDIANSISLMNYESITQETFGHLAPHKNTTYKGEIIVAVSTYDSCNPVILDMTWNMLEDSPWIYDAVKEYLWKLDESFESGKVYKIKATFRNYRFWGKPKECILN